MFRLKFLSLTQGRKKKRSVRSSISFDGRDSACDMYYTSRQYERRTMSSEANRPIPIAEYNDHVVQQHYLPQDTRHTVSKEAHDAQDSCYSRPVEVIRQEEYPHMNKGIYLDHGGATIYAKSTIEAFASKMMSGLYGNPHSANEPAKVSGDMVDDVREQALRFFGADPNHYDLIFVANATAGIKLVADAFRDLADKTRTGTFWYVYHKEAHTSLVGVREFTNGDNHCFESDEDVSSWLDNPANSKILHRRNLTGLGLLAYPGQSNLTGRRLPLSWLRQLRDSQPLQNTYSLLDAAALAMTSPLDHLFSDPLSAPDFTCVSFYKIFGFPDLGGLIVRWDSGHILALRKYFGGGTVNMVSTIGSGSGSGSGGVWHRSKALESGAGARLHEGLEDGTLPFHSILALGEATVVHSRLYGSMGNVSRHTARLVGVLHDGMTALRHPNGRAVIHVYCEEEDDGVATFGDAYRQGATVAFIVFRQDGTYVPYSTVEGMANERGIYVRSGGICCPGGLFSALRYEPWELDRARSAGHHCGSDGLSLIHQLPTGVVRASLGPMSTISDIHAFLSFLGEVFVEKEHCLFPQQPMTISKTTTEVPPENNNNYNANNHMSGVASAPVPLLNDVALSG
ncbi:pyridoxal phosphate-dependent transferase [Coniochaeta sp. 2T2.1]|nr:pyridoxal phosphate-dependent transferase [Coniochaeta sp. 2T2.1]